jgi:hypothetical protein
MVDKAFSFVAPSIMSGVIFTLAPMAPSAVFNAATKAAWSFGSTFTTSAFLRR